MLETAICIVLASLLVVLFRIYKSWDVQLFPVVSINYLVCTVLGAVLYPDLLNIPGWWQQPWFIMAFVQGLCFPLIFFLAGYTSQRVGVAFTGIMTKLSVLFPALLSLLWYAEPLTPPLAAGLVLALLAIGLMNADIFFPRKDKALASNGASIRLMVLGGLGLFLGTGLADSMGKVYQMEWGRQVTAEAYTIAVFGSAAFWSALGCGAMAIRGQLRITPSTLGAGVLLGVPNLFSLVTFLMGVHALPGAVFYPVNNIGQLLLLTLSGIFLFSEKLKYVQWAGVAAAVLAIFLIASDKI